MGNWRARASPRASRASSTCALASSSDGLRVTAAPIARKIFDAWLLGKMPEGMQPPGFYRPVDRGLEIRIGEKLRELQATVRLAAGGERDAALAIVQGGEGGGHTGPVATTLLLPSVLDAVDIPVVAAGGFYDGRGLAAALAYGAAGVAMGTRFLLTQESTVPDAVNSALFAPAASTGTARISTTAARTA